MKAAQEPTMVRRTTLAGMSAAAVLAALVLPGQAPAQSPATPAEDAEVGAKGLLADDHGAESRAARGPTSSKAKGYSPYAGRNYPTRVYFGDTHHHTSNSGDAFANGDRLGPEQSYRFEIGRAHV
jgi:hypothetical protein